MKTLFKYYPSYEWFRFGLLFSLFFISAFVYNLLCPLKRTIVMYMPHAGSEALVYLKPFFIAPASLLFAQIYLSLSLRYRAEFVFRFFIVLFLSYFLSYLVFLDPYRSVFKATSFANFLSHLVPQPYHASLALIEYWMDTLFYVIAELWGTMIVSLLVWGAVNQTTSLQSAKNQYVFFTVGVNGSSICAGSLSIFVNSFFVPGVHHWSHVMNAILLLVIVSGALTWGLYEILLKYQWMQVDRSASSQDDQETHHIFQSALYVFRNHRLLAIAAMVLIYHTLYSLSDVLFSKNVELYFGVHEKMQSHAFLSRIAFMTGVFATVLGLAIYPLCIRMGGWKAAALLAPGLYLFSGCVFYFSQYAQDALSPWVALMLGGYHIALIRGAKYSVFDATKELAYVGMKISDQIQGKAIIDGICSRFGKSLGSLIFFILFGLIGGNLLTTLPYVVFICIILSCVWVWSVLVLDTLCQQKVTQPHIMGLHKNVVTDATTP